MERLNASAELKGQPLVRARLLHEIGSLYFALGEVEAAAPLLEEALRLRQAHLPRDHADLAASLRALGLLRYVQGDPAAIDLHRQAVAILRKQPDPETLELAEAESGLAICLLMLLPNRDQCMQLLQHALAIRRKHLPATDPQVVTNLWVLAWICMEADDPVRGLAYLAEGLAALEGSHADPDLIAAVRLSGKAMQMRWLLGDRAALPSWREALNHLKRVFGERHYLTVKAKRVLAGFLYDAYPEPDPALEEAVTLYDEGLQSGVLPVWEQGLNRLDLGRTQARLGRYEEAERNVRLALPLLRRGGAYAVGSLPHALQMLATLTARLQDPKKPAKIEALLREAVEVSRSNPNVPDFRKAHAFMDLGRFRLLRGDSVTSAALFAEAAEARVRALGPANFEVAEALAYQSAALKAQGKKAVAERLRARAEKILLPQRNNPHPAAVRARLVLAGRMPPWP